LPRWLKDYHIFYELQYSFTDFIKEHGLASYFALSLVLEPGAEFDPGLWNSISSYNVSQSKFYCEGNDTLFNDCFAAVLDAIRGLCNSKKVKFENLFIYRISNRTSWQPFKHALFKYSRTGPARQVNMPGFERYFCNNNRWTANLPIYYSTQRDFTGYLLKKTESCLRQAVKYKYKLSAEMKSGNSYQKSAIDLAELDRVIENAVIVFHRDLSRTVVTVDHANLARIRQEALGTQVKLVVPEEADVADEDTGSGAKYEFDSGLDSGASADYATFSGAAFDTGPSATASPPRSPFDAGAFSDAQDALDNWATLRSALTGVEIGALLIALRGVDSIRAFADENSIMLEVLADGINEKAIDFIGDNILETDEGMTIYDEYRENVAKMVGII